MWKYNNRRTETAEIYREMKLVSWALWKAACICLQLENIAERETHKTHKSSESENLLKTEAGLENRASGEELCGLKQKLCPRESMAGISMAASAI